MKQQIIEMQLKPLQLEMERAIELLQERDTTGIFAEPVKLEEVNSGTYLILFVFSAFCNSENTSKFNRKARRVIFVKGR